MYRVRVCTKASRTVRRPRTWRWASLSRMGGAVGPEPTSLGPRPGVAAVGVAALSRPAGILDAPTWTRERRSGYARHAPGPHRESASTIRIPGFANLNQCGMARY